MFPRCLKPVDNGRREELKKWSIGEQFTPAVAAATGAHPRTLLGDSSASRCDALKGRIVDPHTGEGCIDGAERGFDSLDVSGETGEGAR